MHSARKLAFGLTENGAFHCEPQEGEGEQVQEDVAPGAVAQQMKGVASANAATSSPHAGSLDEGDAAGLAELIN
jgi:hypothetical protein